MPYGKVMIKYLNNWKQSKIGIPTAELDPWLLSTTGSLYHNLPTLLFHCLRDPIFLALSVGQENAVDHVLNFHAIPTIEGSANWNENKNGTD